MTKLILALLTLCFADTPKPQVFVFITPKASCSLSDGKLVLNRAWPLGSWEDCAYAILSAAQQLDQQKDQLTQALNAEKAKVCLGPSQTK